MCGRYSLAPDDFSQIGLVFRVDVRLELSPRYNIAPAWAPGHEAPVVLETESGRALANARFWMIPSSWSRPLRALPTAFNARAEELSSKPFWAPSFERRRCLVPATGWREFRGPRGQREAFQFHFDHRLFAFAGLWDTWQSPSGEEVRSFAIVTVAANDVVAPIHDRMPLVVDVSCHDQWLAPALSGGEALAAATKAPAPLPSVYAAERLGNDPRREGPECIAPLGAHQLELF